MVGDLYYDRADICAAGLAMSLERQQAVDFTFGILSTMQTITARNPGYREGKEASDEAGSINSLSFLHIFALWGWVGVAIMGIVFAFTYALIYMRQVLS